MNTSSISHIYMDLPGGKEPACQCRRHKTQVRALGSSPGSGRSPGGGSGNPLQYLCLENPMDTGTQEPVRLQSMGLQRVGQD